MEGNILYYKDLPLVRSGDEIYYGYTDLPAVIYMRIKTKKMVDDKEIADKISVQLIKTDPNITKINEKIVKSGEAKGFADAMEIASIWLERELKKE